jgi:hypothetical protein
MHREITMRRRDRPVRDQGSRLPGWALALVIVVTGALLAWLHVIVLLGG